MPERDQRIGYNSLKPVVRFAREHWGHPGDTPFRGFEDSAPGNEKQILRNCRRQVFNTAQHWYKKGKSTEEVMGFLNTFHPS